MYRNSRKRKSARRSTRKRQYRGRGDYWSDIASGLLTGGGGALGSAAGMIYGGPVGEMIGGALGSASGKELGRYIGLGDYNVLRNSLMPVNEGQAQPTFGDMSKATIISHREFIQDIVIPGTPATFTNLEFAINPGMQQTFPWLSQIANNYDAYEMLGCIFEFKSTSSQDATALALGSVIMATNYSGEDPAYTDKQAMQNSQYCTSGKPSQSIIHAIECDPSVNVQRQMSVRNGELAANLDIRLSDHGKFQLATVGLPTGSTGNIGELWVTYQIALYKPLLGFTGGAMDHLQLTAPAAAGAAYFGTAFTKTEGSNINGTFTGTTYTFPSTITKGTYLFYYNVKGDSTTLTNALSPLLVGCSVKNFIQASGNDGVKIQAGITHVTQFYAFYITITAKSATVGFSAGTLPANPVSGDAIIMHVNSQVE